MAKELDRFDKNLRKNLSLKAKLIAMIVGASILGVAVTGAMSLKVFGDGLLKNAESEITNTASGVHFILEDWVDNLYRYGNMLSMEPSTKALFTAEGAELATLVRGLASIGGPGGIGAGGPPAGAAAGGAPSNAAAGAQSVTQGLNTFLSNIAERSGLDQLAFINSKGVVFGGYALEAGTSPSHSLIKNALRGNIGYVFDSVGDIEYGIVAAVPVRDGPDIVGAIVIGYELAADRQRCLIS